MSETKFDFSGLPGIDGSMRHAAAATARAAEVGHPVFINDNTEVGERLYSVQLAGTSYWLNSFKRRCNAERFIARNNLKLDS